MVRFEAVHKRYRRGPDVLAGVDLLVRRGEPLLVVGANGSGKSTLLRLAAGCATPSRGRVRGRPAVAPVGTAVAALSEGGRAPVAEAVLGPALAVVASAVTVLVDRRR